MQAFDNQYAGVVAGLHAQGDDLFHQFVGLVRCDLLRGVLQRDRLRNRNHEDLAGEMHRRVFEILRDRFGKTHFDAMPLHCAHDSQCYRCETNALSGGNDKEGLCEALAHL